MFLSIIILLTGWRIEEFDTLTAFKNHIGWVLAGSVEGSTTTSHFVVAIPSCNNILRRFWEIEEVSLSPEGKSVVQHFEVNHSQTLEDSSFLFQRGRMLYP